MNPLLRLTSVLALASCAVGLRAQTSSDVSWGLFPWLEGNWDNQVTRIINDAVAGDVDTLYVSVFRATGPSTGTLWTNDRAGTWDPSWGPIRPGNAGMDVVPLIQAAHAANINVVAVIKCFDGTVQPTNAAHRAYLLEVIDYLFDSYAPDGKPIYDFDGLALDYIRYVEGGTGNDSTIVTNFVGQIRQRIGGLSLHAYLLANRFSFDGPTYDLAFNSYTSTMNSLRSQFGQDWQALAQYIDVYMPMCYTADGSIYTGYNSHYAYVRQAAIYAGIAVANGGFPSRRVVPVIKTYTSTGETTTATTIGASIDGALAGLAEGYQSFRYGTMRNDSSWMQAFRQRATPGPNSPVARFDGALQGLTVDLNASTSIDADEPSANLMARFDTDFDGQFDTPWAPVGSQPALLPTSGSYRMGVQVRDTDGHVAATTRRINVVNTSLSLSAFIYSGSIGGNLDIRIDAGPAAAGSLYLTLASLSGTSPGFTWNGLPVPLNFDGLTNGMLTAVNTPLLQNGLGFCDANGRATATFFMPPGILSPFAFQQMAWCAIAVDPVSEAPRFVTNSSLAFITP